MASDTRFEPTLRLHPLSWLFSLVASVKQLILPLIALVFFGARGNDPGPPFLIPLILLGYLLVQAFWRQWTYRYGFAPRGLVIREGLLFRNVRQIEYTRIENIDTESGVLHRLLRVAQVRIQTSTGGKPEALISVLGQEAVGEIKARVFASARSQEPAIAAGSGTDSLQTLLRLPPAELVRHGLIDNRGMLLIAAGAGVLYESGLFTVKENLLETVLRSTPAAELAALGLAMQIVLTVLFMLTAIVLVRLLSVVMAVVTLYDFTLTRQDNDLRARYGLLTRVALTLRTRRIQAVHQKQTLLHRWLHRVSLNVDLAGDAGGGGEDGKKSHTETRWLAPVCTPAQASRLILAALPWLDSRVEPDWQPLAPRARGRLFRKSAVFNLAILTVPAVWYWGKAGLLVTPLSIALAWIHACLYVKHTRWALTRDTLLFHSGWLTRRLTLVPRDRVQSSRVGASPFDRRGGMASLFVDTAGAAGIRMRYLRKEIAAELAVALYRTAGSGPADPLPEVP